MDQFIPILNDICIIVFDLILFTRLISLKRDTRVYRICMYAGCIVIVAAYFIAAYVMGLPAALATVICMTIPSMALFWCLSKCKDSRFFLTFCFVDTVSLIIAFLGRYVGILLGNLGQLAGLLVVTALYVAILYAGRNYFNRYAQLLEVQKAGWTEMMVSSMLIYAALIFFAAYPRPLVTRLEYAPVYLLFCAVVLSCYLVFVHSIVKTKKIYDQYQLLQREQELYRIAYTDALTGLENRAAYFERIRELQGEFSNLENLCCIVFDINNFKSINDSLGHAVGDRVLCLVAQLLRDTFEQGGVFRMGGDEFFALLTNCEEPLIRKKLQSLEEQLEKKSLDVGMPVYLAAGYDIVKILPQQAQSPGDIIEQAFDRADRNMYRDKAAHKVCPAGIVPGKKD